MKQELSMPTLEEMAENQKKRILSDAKLINGGAEYKVNEKVNMILELSQYQKEEIKMLGKEFFEKKNQEILKIPENIRMAIETLLDNLHNQTNEEMNMDGQCLSRFGMNWKEVCQEVHESLTKGFDLLPSHKDGHSGANAGCLNTLSNISSGHWMINKLIKVMKLKRFYYKEDRFEIIKKLLEQSDKIDNSPYGGNSVGTPDELYIAAPYVMPEKVKEVLESYGFTSESDLLKKKNPEKIGEEYIIG